MSFTSRLVRPPRRIAPPQRRGYSSSSFFSSSNNGGRTPNTAKAPKISVAPKKAAGEVSSAQQKDNSTSTTTAATNTNNSNSSTNNNVHAAAPPAPQLTTPSNAPTPPYHPLVGAKEFKMHQFFALHRPLLLLSSEAGTVLSTAPRSGPLYASSSSPSPSLSPVQDALFAQHDMSEAEADAETARQLTRALTMGRAGALADWEDTLRRLGWDVEKEGARQEAQAQMKEEWKGVVMDSVKRKRRKKMKKHKLKKRRRLTRSERLKLK